MISMDWLFYTMHLTSKPNEYLKICKNIRFNNKKTA